MTNTTPTANTYDAILERASELGSEHGTAAGTWLDVSADNAARLIQGVDDGDPEILDIMPSPLSGEWADGMTPDGLRDELGVNELVWGDLCDEACTNYELGYSQGYWDEVTRRARYHLDSDV